MKKKYGRLGRKPRAYAVTGLMLIKRLAFVEKRAGSKDRKENQLCTIEDGQTTPYVEARHKHYENYINNTYLSAEHIREKEVAEAEKLITELHLLQNYKPAEVSGNVEEVSRANRLAAEKVRKNSERIEEIILKLSEIKAFIEGLDEKLSHHIEAAGDLMDVHVANYWKGILKASSDGGVNVEPVYITKQYEGRQRYFESRDELLNKLNSAIANGGGVYEEE